jgi:hypothetical protein
MGWVEADEAVGGVGPIMSILQRWWTEKLCFIKYLSCFWGNSIFISIILSSVFVTYAIIDKAI